MISLNELQVFLVAAELGNFSEAGRKLSLTQSAVSQTINNLEKHLGVKLFERTGRTVFLSPSGQALEPMARELIAASKRLEETMCSLQGKVVGEMTIGCSTTSGKYLLPGLIAQFRGQYPQVRINVIVHSRGTVINKLLNGDLPLGMSSKKVDHHDLEYQDFFTDEIILIVPKEHRWASFRQVFPDDLLDEPMILREEGAGTREMMLEGLQAHDISPDMLNIAMILGNAEAIEMAVEEGIGIAFISRLAAAKGLALDRVVEIQVKGMQLTRSIWMARNRRFPATRAQQEFWDFVKNNHPNR